ncbi:hypothetical protein BD626DRAFT_478989 [Schizophyllum amplum]|uniref:Uncharacterized protein n=1 Tax=Schizophyllum amplum TaxID=97359 RepID=A0A550CRT3_9AGAR|nr:hypothetical protein BD626DRAFT_478989 [Auriculariopsis ampla]
MPRPAGPTLDSPSKFNQHRGTIEPTKTQMKTEDSDSLGCTPDVDAREEQWALFLRPEDSCASQPEQCPGASNISTCARALYPRYSYKAATPTVGLPRPLRRPERISSHSLPTARCTTVTQRPPHGGRPHSDGLTTRSSHWVQHAAQPRLYHLVHVCRHTRLLRNRRT